MLSRGDGGLEKHVAELANALSEVCQLTVIADPKYKDSYSPAVDFKPVNARLGRMNLKLAWQLKNIVDEVQPDIIHAHAGKAACLVALIKPFVSAKLVVTRHNTTNPSAFYLKRFDARIAVSHKVAASEPRVNWHVVENGTHPLQASSPAIQLERPAIVTVGRLVKIKCLDHVLTAWDNPEAHLYIIGDGPERSSLEQQVKNAKLTNVHFVGFTDKVGDYLTQADMMLMPSLKEGAPYAMVEALLAEVPVICTDVGNARALLPEQAIIEKESPSAIKASIDRCLDSPEDFKAEFEGSFAYARENLTLEKMLEKTYDVYKSL